MSKESIYQNDANEIIDAVLRNKVNSQVCVVATGAFEEWGVSNHTRADYAIEHIGDDGLLFTADMPANVAEGDYFFVYTARAGEHPADNDSYRGQSQPQHWDGDKFIEMADLLMADSVIDTTTIPWSIVLRKKGTQTELLRKSLNDVNGEDITSIATVIGQQVEEE